MNTTITLTREEIHPPIALTNKALINRAAIWSGIALIRWARRSDLLRSQRLARQNERAVRQHELEKLQVELAAERARTDAYLLFRSLT